MKKIFSLIVYPILLLLDTGHKHRSEGSPWQNISCIYHKTCKSTIYMYNSSITIFKEVYSSFILFNMHALCMFHLLKIIFTGTALKCFKIQCFYSEWVLIRSRYQYPSSDGRTIWCGGRLVNILTGEPYLFTSPRNRVWLS